MMLRVRNNEAVPTTRRVGPDGQPWSSQRGSSTTSFGWAAATPSAISSSSPANLATIPEDWPLWSWVQCDQADSGATVISTAKSTPFGSDGAVVAVVDDDNADMPTASTSTRSQKKVRFQVHPTSVKNDEPYVLANVAVRLIRAALSIISVYLLIRLAVVVTKAAFQLMRLVTTAGTTWAATVSAKAALPLEQLAVTVGIYRALTWCTSTAPAPASITGATIGSAQQQAFARSQQLKVEVRYLERSVDRLTATREQLHKTHEACIVDWIAVAAAADCNGRQGIATLTNLHHERLRAKARRHYCHRHIGRSHAHRNNARHDAQVEATYRLVDQLTNAVLAASPAMETAEVALDRANELLAAEKALLDAKRCELAEHDQLLERLHYAEANQAAAPPAK